VDLRRPTFPYTRVFVKLRLSLKENRRVLTWYRSIEDYAQSVLPFPGRYLRLQGGQYSSDDRIILPAVQDVFFSFSDAINLTKFEWKVRRRRGLGAVCIQGDRHP